MLGKGILNIFFSKVLVCSILVLIITTQSYGLYSIDESSYKTGKSNIEVRDFKSGLGEVGTENLDWIKNNMFRSKEVRPNKLGLQRIHENARKKEPSLYSYSTDTSVNILPSSVDNSQLKSFPPIGDQGTLGSCAAFSTTYYQLTHMFGLALGWDVKNDADNSLKFSPKWTFNLTNVGENFIMSVYNAYNLFYKCGAAKWSEFPYQDDISDPKSYQEWPTDGNIWRNALNYRIDEYGYVEIWDETDTPVKDPDSGSLLEIKHLLNNGYVLVFETNVTGWRFSAAKDDPSTYEDNAYVNQHAAYAAGSSAMPGDGHVMLLKL
ncbi:MAG: hypothetical protein ACOYWZ_01620 [Bacillota bacterium]